MPRPHSLYSALLLTVLVLAPGVSRGADVLQEVPSDALGFVLVHNLATIDAKVGQLASMLQRNLPRPLAFLKEVTGVGDGLNPQGDFLLVLFPGADGNVGQPQFCVWLPVADYDRFIKSIGATPVEGIAAATIAGEDLLVARRGEWALVMDPDQRDRLAQLVAAPPSPPPQLAAWKQWTDANDITVIAFAPGIRALMSWAEGTGDDLNGKPGDGSDDNLFGSTDANGGPDKLVARGANRSPAGGVLLVLSELHKWTAVSPEIAQAIQQANVVGCGIWLDASSNMLASLRVALNDSPASDPIDAKGGDLPFDMYERKGFVINGGGRLPKSVLVTLASAYIRRTADDLKTEEHTELDDATLKRLQEAVEQAAADVRSALVLTQPGAETQPVCTNNFVAVRVSSADTFIGHANEVMRLWNTANRDAKGETRLVFDVEETKLGDRTATQYSLDIAAMEGGPALPEIRQAMEKLFGPGGKLRFWIVPVDDESILLATATPEQVTAILKSLDRKQSIDWNRGELSDSNRLLSAESDWRVFFDAHRYYHWLGRQAVAMTGVPIIGGPLVRPFPESPPVGIAGGFRDHELWLEMAALAPTVKSANAYLTPIRFRSTIPPRLQPVPR